MVLLCIRPLLVHNIATIGICAGYSLFTCVRFHVRFIFLVIVIYIIIHSSWISKENMGSVPPHLLYAQSLELVPGIRHCSLSLLSVSVYVCVGFVTV